MPRSSPFRWAEITAPPTLVSRQRLESGTVPRPNLAESAKLGFNGAHL